MKHFIIISLLLCFQISLSQNNEGKDNNLCIKTNPISIIDAFGSSSYRIGLELKVYKNISLSGEYGRYFDIKGLDLRENSKGYILKPEIKWYVNKNGMSKGNFISLEYTYKDISYDWKDSIPTTSDPSRVMKYRIHKNINCFTAKIGNLKTYSNNIIFEWFFGIGLRLSKGNDSLTNEERDSIKAFDENEISTAQKNTNYILPNLSLGIKIGYRLY
ncbi:hypothetical protein [Flavobacterium sp.]|uniref:hypothetical protein n=1 Tax=Flavobacterium sp. TaxID=239 RepID=UPI003D6B673E